MESKCLARYDEDDLWYKATVVEIGENHDVTVTFDSYDDECITVPLEDILPTVMLDLRGAIQKFVDKCKEINNNHWIRLKIYEYKF